MRIDGALGAAAAKIGSSSDSPRLDAELLLMHILDQPRSFLLAHPEHRLDDDARSRFDGAVQRRLNGEPVAYILGRKDFWTLRLAVTPDTLVPRPETELLVDLALRELGDHESPGILDLGTGSGAIALALASERPHASIIATDISEATLAVARQNAASAGIDNVMFLQGDWLAPLSGRHFDLVVSNPPYVSSNDPALADLRHEPRAALAAGTDGLDAIRVIAASCMPLLQPAAPLLLEHGSTQATQVAALLQQYGWQNVRCHADLAGLPRVTVASAKD